MICRIREKLETVVPMIESGYINNILLQDDFQTYQDNYRELLDIREEYGYMIVARIRGFHGKWRSYQCGGGQCEGKQILFHIPGNRSGIF